MTAPPFSAESSDSIPVFVDRLRHIYRDMDEAYERAARESGFSCDHCDGELCCTVDLRIHTFAEKVFLRQGLAALDSNTRDEICTRCERIVAAKRRDPHGDDYRNSICALNFSGRCILYEYRPMICRLAGIPHFMVLPNGSRQERGGCRRYEREFRPSKPNLLVDRTALYREMALLELDAVRERRQRTTIETVSETLLGDQDSCG